MGNDKVFITYALILIAGIASILTASVATGVATLPGPLIFLEHLALSFGFRAAYKGIGGFSWDDWSVAGEAVAAAPSDAELVDEPGAAHGTA